jgi:signal transduction histidine kinase
MEFMQKEERRMALNAVQQAEERERQRIAADLHDNLGAYAASIASNIDHLTASKGTNEEALRELRNNALAIVSQLSDSIWALKKDELSLTAISDRIKVFISRIRKSYPDVQVVVEEAIASDHKLPTSQAFHLYRILQEAISNALRHSHATHIRVLFSAGESWSASVTDNGSGMDGRETAAGGNGLVNMKERSREAGWVIRWEQARPRGTRVEVTPTTN